MELQPPNSHHLLAATGWLELGNHLEANEELEKIEPQLRSHPEVLAVRWTIYYRANKFDACMEIATTLTKVDPNSVQSWVGLSISLYKTGNTQQAHDALAENLGSFPTAWVVYYNLACYAAQLGKIREARDYLERAITFGEKDQVKLIALEDPDMEPLWQQIGST